MCLHYKYVCRFQGRKEAVCGQSEALSDHCEWLTGCETQGSLATCPSSALGTYNPMFSTFSSLWCYLSPHGPSLANSSVGFTCCSQSLSCCQQTAWCFHLYLLLPAVDWGPELTCPMGVSDTAYKALDSSSHPKSLPHEFPSLGQKHHSSPSPSPNPGAYLDSHLPHSSHVQWLSRHRPFCRPFGD